MNRDLVKETTRFIKEGHVSPCEMYSSLLKEGDNISLSQVIRLIDCDYGGSTYKWELKNSALLLVLHWEEKGILSLKEMVLRNPTHSNISLVTKFLAYVASGKLELFPLYIKCGTFNKEYLESQKWKTETIRISAQSVLVDIMKGIEKETSFPLSAISSLFTSGLHNEVSEQIFSSLVMRWFKLNTQSIQKYNSLIEGEQFEEIKYHNFLKENPHLIEPFHSEFWSKPRFGEGLQPDFLFRLMDDNYVVVEIEKPWLPILTNNGNLSSYTTHAKRQALDYREWAISNQLYAKERFPKIWRPFALVVIGMEKDLSSAQIERLKQENESTQGVLRVVGFDWIYSRSITTFENLIKYGFNKPISD